MLAQLGVTETDALKHSPKWIEDALDAAHMDFRSRTAMHIRATHAAAQAAFNGGEAYEYMQDMIDDLTSPTDAESEPSGEAEMAHLEALGVGKTITAEEAANVH